MSSLRQQDALTIAHVPDGAIVAPAPEARVTLALGRLVGRGIAARLLSHAGYEGVARMPARELAATAGVPLRAAERVVAARDLADAVAPAGPQVRVVADLLAHLPPGLARAEVELMLAVALSSQMRVKAIVVLAKGGDASMTIEMRDVLRPLVRLGAAQFALVHNHPGGDPTPSAEDVDLTNRVARAGRVVGIDLVEHVVVAARGVVSFHDTGLLPTAHELPF